MKGKAALLLIMAVLIISTASKGLMNYQEGITEEELPREDHEWLLLIYMAGDNDLGRDNEEWGNPLKMDLKEIERSMPSSGAKVLALADFYGPENTYLYDMQNNQTRDISSPTIPLSTLDPGWGNELDMSDSAVLTRFLTYSLGNYSAERTMFVIWDHGSGWYFNDIGPGSKSPGPDTRGFSQDLTNGGLMYLDEFRDAFKEAEEGVGSINMDIIGFDTCSMGMMEVYYQVSNWFDLALGSEDEQPYYGYNYSFVSSMGGSNPLEPLALGKEVIRLFSLEYSEPNKYAYGSIALVDLQLLSTTLTSSLDDLNLYLIERMYQNEVLSIHAFHSIVTATEAISYTEPDLGDLLRRLASSNLQEDITYSANTTFGIYRDVVIEHWLKSDGRNPYGTGMSIYLPRWRETNPVIHQEYPGSSGFLDFTMDSLWDEMLSEYHSPMERVRVLLNISALDPDLLEDDLTIEALNPQAEAVIPNASVFVNGEFISNTDEDGVLLLKDLLPDTYRIEVFNGTHVGEASIKVLNRPPQIDITPSDPVIYQGDILVLDASGSWDPDGDDISFSWDLDPSDGLNDTDSVKDWVQLTYLDPGNYTIKLSISDMEFTATELVNIQVINLPPYTELSLPPYVFEDSYFEINASGSWDIGTKAADLEYRYIVGGDIVVDWTSSPRLKYISSDSGDLNIEVQVRDEHGGVNSTSVTLKVLNPGPVANFTSPDELWEGQRGTLDASLSYDTSSDLPYLNYTWYIQGDAEPIGYGSQIEFSHLEEGNATIELVVSDDDNASSSIFRKIRIRNRAPFAVITGPAQVDEDMEFTLSALSSTDSPWDMDGLRYLWDLDDDGTIDREGATVLLNLTDQGTERITLTVVDGDGASSSIVHVLDVVNRSPVPFILGNGTGQEDQVMLFEMNDDADTPSDLSTLYVEWIVDGEVVSNESSLEHIFTEKGRHTVELKVADDQYAIGSAQVQVLIINPPPTAVITGVPSVVEVGSSISASGGSSLDNPSDLGSLVYKWSLDGEPLEGSGMNLTFILEDPGSYELTLRVTDDDGDWSEVKITIEAEGSSFLGPIGEFFTSPAGLVLLLGIVLLIVMVVYQLSKKTGELPDTRKLLEEIPQEDEEIDEPAGEYEVPDEGEDPVLEPADEAASDTDDDLPEMEEPDMGPVPEPVEEMEMPGIEPDLFDGPEIGENDTH